MRQPIRQIQFALLLGLIVFNIGCYEQWSDTDIAESKQRGDTIIIAIKEFHNKNGDYPDQLSELVPDYLPEIQQPTVGKKQWDYRSLDNSKFEKFRLSFTGHSALDHEYYFTDRSKQWGHDSK